MCKSDTVGFPIGQLPTFEEWQLPSGSLRFIDRPETLLDARTDGAWFGSGKVLEACWRATPERLLGLKYLVVEQHRISSSAIDVIRQLTLLERLYLSRIPSADLAFLRDLTNLSYLCIEAAPNVNADSEFPPLGQLQSLGLGTAIDTLEPLVHAYPQLCCLLLHGPTESRPARFHNLDALTGLQSLEYLALTNCRTQDRRLAALLELPKLRAIVIGSERWWEPADLEALRTAGVSFSNFLEIRRDRHSSHDQRAGI